MNQKSYSLKLAAAALFMLLCVFATGGIKASADTAITQAELKIDAPSNGKTIDFTTDITKGTGFQVDTETAEYPYTFYDYRKGGEWGWRYDQKLLNGVGWYNLNEKKNETKKSKYASNHEYSLVIKLKAKSGYVFSGGVSSSKYTINGQPVDVLLADYSYDRRGYQAVYLHINFEYYDYELYDLWIGGGEYTVRASAGNASDIKGDGVFSYDAKTKTLHLNGGTFNGREREGIRSTMDGLTISVDKDTALSNCNIGIALTQKTTITGKGKLTINNSESTSGSGIASAFNLEIINANIDISDGTFLSPIYGYYNIYDQYDPCTYSTLKIVNSDITARSSRSDLAAVDNFQKNITLESCTITTPSGGKAANEVYEDEYGLHTGPYRIVGPNGDYADKVTIKKSGNFIGYCTVTIPYSSYTYRGRGIKPTVTVKDGSAKLTKGTDYTVSYKNNTNAGTATITVTGKGKYTGTTTKTFTVKKLDLSSSYAKISIPYSSYTYTGSAIKPAVTVKFKDGDVIPTSDYSLSYANNKNVGVATITVKGKGTNVTGTYKKTFVVKPAKNEITSISTTSGAFKIAWKKGTAGTTGYQVQYSTDKNFEKNVHSWTTTSLSKLSENFSSVPRSGETWYVKVRSFYTKDGKTTSTRYGNYSAVKSIKIK